MHRLCKPQGYMINIQSYTGGNGFYRFEESFYESAAAANGYKILYAAYIPVLRDLMPGGTDMQYHIPLSEELLHVLDWTKLLGISICYVYQKTSDADFQIPYENPYLAQRAGYRGYEMEFYPDPPARQYIPAPEKTILERYADQDITTRVMMASILQKLQQRLGFGRRR